ncbi:hypothetical protein ACFQ68_13260 [Amycolatopsis japonica]|uniref:hypothetical protein n=1 Tax=Amycolatopsis japonica TaxID=208439 RepID=UPI003671D6A8
MAEPADTDEHKVGDAAARLGLSGTIAALERQARAQAGDDEALFHRTMAMLLYGRWASVSYHVDRRQCTLPQESAQADLLITLAIDHRYAARTVGG